MGNNAPMTQQQTTSATDLPAPRILIVDDDADIRDLLADFLVRYGFEVTTAADGRDLRDRLAQEDIDLVVLDVMMPGEDGLSLCKSLRAAGQTVPVIMLTAMGEEVDRIIGLEVGADDYLPKPFNPRELAARIRAVLRRATAPDSAQVQEDAQDTSEPAYLFADFLLDPATRTVSRAGVDMDLSAGEYDLLLAFATHPRRVLSRDFLLDLSRGRQAMPFDRSVDVQVGRLRRKIEADPQSPELIRTVRGGGYMFTPAVTRGRA